MCPACVTVALAVAGAAAAVNKLRKDNPGLRTERTAPGGAGDNDE